MTTQLDTAKAVADAVLYEGYLLYPYRASAAKNQTRWQFGVLMPPDYADAGHGEHAWAQTECLLEAEPGALLHVRARYLQVQRRTIEQAQPDGGFRQVEEMTVGDDMLLPWDEAVERWTDVVVTVDELLAGERDEPVTAPATTECETVADGHGRIVRACCPVEGSLRLSAERLPGPYGALRLRAVLRNVSDRRCDDDSREEALRHALVAAHTAFAVTGGSFLSLLEPPEWAAAYAEECVNERTWPVLVGEQGQRDTVLSSPIILYDYPEIAPESTGTFYDGTEIDELLALRTATLTEEEKREARATDPRAREVVDRATDMPPELLERLHGAVREMHPAARKPDPVETVTEPDRPWWEPGADDSVDPETDSVLVGDRHVSKGDKVVLRPGLRRSDAQDMFLVGRVATVQAVFLDLDDERYLAVSLDDDPAAELQSAHGRFRYFSAEEVEALAEQP